VRGFCLFALHTAMRKCYESDGKHPTQMVSTTPARLRSSRGYARRFFYEDGAQSLLIEIQMKSVFPCKLRDLSFSILFV